MSNILREDYGREDGTKTKAEIENDGKVIRAALDAANTHNTGAPTGLYEPAWPLPSTIVEAGKRGVRSAREALMAAVAARAARVELEVMKTPNMNDDPVAMRMSEIEQRLLDAGLSWHERGGDWFMSRSNE